MKRLLAYFTWRRALVNTGVVVYSLALFLIFDFAYTTLTQGQEQQHPVRVANPVYDHGLVANFDGYDFWGSELRYRMITNSLGFKDGSVREVPLKPTSRRILLIGDSFTEGIGLNFEDTFAGMLARAGQERSDKIEFLNAGVVSYSPSIYYKKIKYFLERGLQFDEVVVFSDPSDVRDEATSYFCIDDDPKYRAHCSSDEGSQQTAAAPPSMKFFANHFAVTNGVRIYIKRSLMSWLGNRRRAINTDHPNIGWVFGAPSAAEETRPLGVDGGIARSLQNMGALSDMLAARNIPLTIVVYPWAQQLAQNDRDSRQVSLWRDFCRGRCKAFIDLFPAFFAETERDKNWYEHLYILGDLHYSAAGNRFLFRQIEKQLLQ